MSVCHIKVPTERFLFKPDRVNSSVTDVKTSLGFFQVVMPLLHHNKCSASYHLFFTSQTLRAFITDLVHTVTLFSLAFSSTKVDQNVEIPQEVMQSFLLSDLSRLMHLVTFDPNSHISLICRVNNSDDHIFHSSDKKFASAQISYEIQYFKKISKLCCYGATLVT